MNVIPHGRIFASKRLCIYGSTSKLQKYGKRFQSTARSPKVLKTPTDIEEYLSKPSWSVKDLAGSQEQPKESQISREKLHHLLRLSALPLPTSDAEESRMIKDLESQLHFVQAIQKIDTVGVEPLQSIRDETEEARQANIIGLADLQEYLDKETVSGKRGRIRNKADCKPRKPASDGQDLLSQAPKRLGRYVVVDTAKD